MDDVVVEGAAHGAGGVVCKASHVEALHGAHALYQGDYGKVDRRQGQHALKRACALHYVEQVLDHLPLEVGAQREARVVHNAAHGDDCDGGGAAPEVGRDAVGWVRFHHFSHLSVLSGPLYRGNNHLSGVSVANTTDIQAMLCHDCLALKEPIGRACGFIRRSGRAKQPGRTTASGTSC